MENDKTLISDIDKLEYYLFGSSLKWKLETYHTTDLYFERIYEKYPKPEYVFTSDLDKSEFTMIIIEEFIYILCRNIEYYPDGRIFRTFTIPIEYTTDPNSGEDTDSSEFIKKLDKQFPNLYLGKKCKNKEDLAMYSILKSCGKPEDKMFPKAIESWVKLKNLNINKI